MKRGFTLATAPAVLTLLIAVFAKEAMTQRRPVQPPHTSSSQKVRDTAESALESSSGEGFETQLITSTLASELVRSHVELAAAPGACAGVPLSDGSATIGKGKVEFEADGDVELKLESVSVDGAGFLLINQWDTDGDGDRDFVEAASLTIAGGKVEGQLGELLPFGTSLEDPLITILLDHGNGILDAGDTILAVPGFALTGEDDEGEDDEEDD
jgi:hypothetical protein